MALNLWVDAGLVLVHRPACSLPCVTGPCPQARLARKRSVRARRNRPGRVFHQELAEEFVITVRSSTSRPHNLLWLDGCFGMGSSLSCLSPTADTGEACTHARGVRTLHALPGSSTLCRCQSAAGLQPVFSLLIALPCMPSITCWCVLAHELGASVPHERNLTKRAAHCAVGAAGCRKGRSSCRIP